MQTGDRIARRYVAIRLDDSQREGATTFVGRDERLQRDVTIHVVTSVAPTAVVKAAHRARLVPDQRIARVLAAGTETTPDGRRSYVVTERRAGIGLDELLGKAALTPDVAAAVIGSAADALALATRAGVPHGVIEARHLTVTSQGRVVIGGLGFEGELASQAGHQSRHREREDATTLARLYVAGVAGRDVADITEDDLPADLPEAARDIALTVLKGKPVHSFATLVEALGSGSYPALRLLAEQAPRLWWPSPPALPPAPEPVADAADALVTDAPVAEDTAGAADGAVAVDTAPGTDADTDADTEEIDRIDADIATDVELAPSEAELIDDAAVIEAEPEVPQRPLTRFGRAVDDLDEFHDIVAEQNVVVRPSVAEAVLTWLQRRFPSSRGLARAVVAAHERAQTPAPIRPGPLLVSLFIVGVFVASLIALDRIQTPIEPLGDNVPGEDYPEFSFGPQAPAAEE